MLVKPPRKSNKPSVELIKNILEKWLEKPSDEK
jgi:hypothetical protein